MKKGILNYCKAGWVFLCLVFFYSCAKPEKPNVLLILIDDMGYADLSCYGNTNVVTANIDRLATGGTRFMQYYSNSPIGSPARVALQTGQYPQRFAISTNFSFRQLNSFAGMADYLSDTVQTMAKVLRHEGYRTGYFGKWQMGGGFDITNAPLPQQLGFEKSIVSSEGLGPRILITDEKLSSVSAQLDTAPIYWATAVEADKMFADSALRFIEASSQAPFFVQLSFKGLKSLYDIDTTNPSKGMHRQMQFDYTLKQIDKLVGQVVDHLEKTGKLQQTIIILTSDNGPDDARINYSQGATPPGSVGNLRGRKWSLYEGGIRVPFIISGSNAKIPSRVDETTVTAAIDVLPTLCTMLNIQSDTPMHFDGVDMSAAWQGQTQVRTTPLFWEYRGSPQPGNSYHISPRLAIRINDWKLLVSPDTLYMQLYNLRYDPSESSNVVGNDPEMSDSLSAKVIAWYKSTKANRPTK